MNEKQKRDGTHKTPRGEKGKQPLVKLECIGKSSVGRRVVFRTGNSDITRCQIQDVEAGQSCLGQFLDEPRRSGEVQN